VRRWLSLLCLFLCAPTSCCAEMFSDIVHLQQLGMTWVSTVYACVWVWCTWHDMYIHMYISCIYIHMYVWLRLPYCKFEQTSKNFEGMSIDHFLHECRPFFWVSVRSRVKTLSFFCQCLDSNPRRCLRDKFSIFNPLRIRAWTSARAHSHL
jgi:hypothetical protein